MSGTAIGTSLNLGFAGKISRNPYNKIRSRMVKSILDGNGAETLSAINFGGAAVVNADNTYSRFGQSGNGVTAAAAASFAGIAVSEVKQSMSLSYGANTATGQYEPGMPCDILRQGVTTVFCNEGTPSPTTGVYIMTVAGTKAAVGDFVATATPTGTGATSVQLTNCRWTTGKQDASGITEIEILYPVTA
jgi:hypothetical protein